MRQIVIGFTLILLLLTTGGDAGTLAAVDRLETRAGAPVTVQSHPVTGVARLVTLPPEAIRLTAADDPAPKAATAASGFLARHGDLFGIDDAARQLRLTTDRSDRLGWRHLSFAQVADEVPVFGAVLRVHVDDAGWLRAVNGTFVPQVPTAVRAEIASSTAEALAAQGTAKGFDLPVDVLTTSSRLVHYHTGLVRSRPGTVRLAWEVEVANGDVVLERVLVDATRGTELDRFREVHELSRFVARSQSNNIIWRENDPLPFAGIDPSLDAEVNTVIEAMEDTWQLFSHLSGGTYLSYDGNDRPMLSIYDSAQVECPNAVATGNATHFCIGVASDDVVAHEWVHNYTGATHGLIYAWQPGALNEAYSDIFGETVDLLNGIGADDPDILRTADTCSEMGGGAPPELTVASPASVAGGYAAGGAAFNPLPPWTTGGILELVTDDAGQSSDGCSALEGFTSGRVALIDRGNCLFRDKVGHAANAGAVAAIVVIHEGDDVMEMGGSGARLPIPSVFIGQSDGAALKAVLDENVTVTMSQSAAEGASLRWLVSEDSPQFGGAIRDMWHPNCFGDPGAVTDSQYFCGEGDSGGVHTNSGVPNRAFALVVDGGSVSGIAVEGIGLTKAAHVWWRAMSVYQVPTSDFTDHADALELSCADLVGASLSDLETGDPSAEVLTTRDCDQISAALTAVEMRTAPDQCGFEPILAKDPPPIAGTPLLDETFEAPPEGWTFSNDGVYAEYQPRDWVFTTELPAGALGDGAMFALNSISLGDCQPGSNDQSGVMRLASPPVQAPTGMAPPVVSFDHWLATEYLWDGGNLKLKVEDGPWQLVPHGAFRYNPYNQLINSPGRGNTNPLAGQQGFTGADGGSFEGSWGTSIVDLRGLVRPGETFQIRFDLGVDGCNGLVGWFLDAVSIRAEPIEPRRGERVSG